MQPTTFHQKTWFRATSACLLTATIAFAGWLDIKTATALPVKVIQIRPMPPAFKAVPVLRPHEIPPSRGLAPDISGIKPRAAILPEHLFIGPEGRKLLSPSEAYGAKAAVTQPKVDFSRFGFVENENQLAFRFQLNTIYPRSGTLDDWYPPAADLAQSRSSTANFLAERAVRQYKSIVGVSDVLNDARGRRPSQKSMDDAQQLALRLIHAVLEDTDPDPPGFAPPPASIAGVQQNIVNALNNTASLAVRPMGTRIWVDLLNQDFSRAAYHWQGRVVGPNEAGIVNLQVDSMVLPTTVTTIDVGSYASAAVESQIALRRILKSLNTQRSGAGYFNQFNTK